MVRWNLVYSKYAIKDAKKIAAAGLKEKAQILLDILEELTYNINWFMRFFVKKKQFVF